MNIEQVANEFRKWYTNEVKVETTNIGELNRITGIAEAAITFENILCRHLIQELNNDTTNINNLLNPSNTRPECGRTEDR